MSYEKVDVCGYKINVAFEENAIRIKNDNALSLDVLFFANFI